MEEYILDINKDYKDDFIMMKSIKAELMASNEFTLIRGVTGCGKSRFIMSLIAGYLGYNSIEGIDFTECPKGKHIVYISTEMSNAHLKLRTTGLKDAVGDIGQLIVVNLKGLSRDYMAKELPIFLSKYSPYIVIVDHLLSMMRNMNDMDASSDLEDLIKSISLIHGCAVIGVVHQNPGASNDGKAGGNIGSALEKAATSIFTISKNEKKGTWALKANKVREGDTNQVWKGSFNNDYKFIDFSNISDTLKTEEKEHLIERLSFPGNLNDICAQIGKITGERSLITQKNYINRWASDGLIESQKDGRNTIINRV